MNEKIFENIEKEYNIFAKEAGKIKKDDKRNILLGALLGILAAKKTYDFELNKDFIIKGIEKIEGMLWLWKDMKLLILKMVGLKL